MSISQEHFIKIHIIIYITRAMYCSIKSWIFCNWETYLTMISI